MGFVSGNVSAVLSLKASTLIVAGTRLPPRREEHFLNLYFCKEGRPPCAFYPLLSTFSCPTLSASSETIYITVKKIGLFQPVKGCLSCAHVQRSNDNSIK